MYPESLQMASELRARPIGLSPIKWVLTFAAHQLVGTWGMAFFAAFALGSLVDLIPDSLAWKPFMRFFHWILTENPFYPVQIIAGLYAGWRLGLRYQHKSMFWVWLMPLALLLYAVLTGFVLIPELSSILARPLTFRDRISHYFGWGCQPRAHCLDQLIITMPFYASVSYSLGALLARRRTRTTPRDVSRNFLHSAG